MTTLYSSFEFRFLCHIPVLVPRMRKFLLRMRIILVPIQNKLFILHLLHSHNAKKNEMVKQNNFFIADGPRHTSVA